MVQRSVIPGGLAYNFALPPNKPIELTVACGARSLSARRWEAYSVPVHKGKIVPPGTLRAILRDAEISVEEFRKLL